MSKIVTWVQAVDNLFYANPIIYNDSCYLCFDDPEVVIKASVQAPKRMITKWLQDSGIQAKIKGVAFKNQRCFPPNWVRFVPATSYSLTLCGPIPVPDDHRGCTDIVTGDCCIYRFNDVFSTETVLSFFIGQRVHMSLTTLLLQTPGFTEPGVKDCKKIKKMILAQYPTFECTDDLESLVREYGPKIRIRRIM